MYEDHDRWHNGLQCLFTLQSSIVGGEEVGEAAVPSLGGKVQLK